MIKYMWRHSSSLLSHKMPILTNLSQMNKLSRRPTCLCSKGAIINWSNQTWVSSQLSPLPMIRSRVSLLRMWICFRITMIITWRQSFHTQDSCLSHPSHGYSLFKLWINELLSLCTKDLSSIAPFLPKDSEPLWAHQILNNKKASGPAPKLLSSIWKTRINHFTHHLSPLIRQRIVRDNHLQPLSRSNINPSSSIQT